MKRLARILLLIVGLLLLQAVDIYAQEADTVITDMKVLAEFEEAAALDVDPAGLLYVVDKGSHSIHQLHHDGTPINELGGPGGGEGQFDFPSDIDATNGLVLVVADAGNGRIQRFSKDFLFLESLALDLEEANAGGGFSSEPAYRQREQSVEVFDTGKPISLITSPNNDMYAIDEISNLLVKWDKNRNIEQLIGAYDQGQGSLIEPVSIALGIRGEIFVADRGLEAIQVYDVFGGFDRSMANGLCANVQAIYVDGNWLMAVMPAEILVFQTRGLLELRAGFDTKEKFVDVAVFKNTLFLLTEHQLLSVPWIRTP